MNKSQRGILLCLLRAYRDGRAYLTAEDLGEDDDAMQVLSEDGYVLSVGGRTAYYRITDLGINALQDR